MGGVADFVGDVVGGAADVVGDVVSGAGDLVGDAVEIVADSVGDTIEGVVNTTEAFLDDPIEFAEAVVDNALDNPIETAAIVAAAYFAPELVAELAPELGASATSVASKAVTGAAKSAITGDSILEGAITGAVSGAVDLGKTAIKDGISYLKDLPSEDLIDDYITEAVDYTDEAADLGDFEVGEAIDLGDEIPELETGLATLPIEEDILTPAPEFTLGDQPGDFPLEGSFGQPTAPGVQEAVQDLLDYNAGITTQLPKVIGDQPGDYPLNQEELDLAAQELKDIPFGSLGDQPGDYPLTEQDLALEDELMGQIGDQPGDYPTEGGYGDPMAPGVKEAVKDLLDYNAGIATGTGGGSGGSSSGGGASGGGLSPVQLAALAGIGALASKGINMPDVPRLGYQGPPLQYTAERIPGRGVKYTPVQAAQGGLMNLMDPSNSVAMYQSGGITEAEDALAKSMKATAGQSVGIANQMNYLLGRGLSPEQAKQIIQQGVNVYSFAQGGISDLGSYTHATGGRMLKGPGDGMSDSIPATIEGKRPARLATDEFVVPADVVSHLGNGSSDAGAKVLYEMMDKVRKARTGTTKQGKQINPRKYLPK